MTPQDVEILLLGVLVALPVLTGVWATLWSMVWKALRFLGMMLVVEKRASRPDGRAVVMQHLGGRLILSGPEQFDCTSRFVSTLSARRMIFELNQNDGWRLYLVGWCPLLYVEKTEDAGRFFYLRGTLDWLRFLKRIEDAHDVWVQRERVLRERRFCVNRVAGGADEQLVYRGDGPPTPAPVKYGGFVPYLWPEEEGRAVDLVGATLDDLALTPALREAVDDVRFWVDHRDWYRDRGVAWRRGYLFHGGPGTGKSSMVRAIGEALDIPVTVMDLSAMSNKTFAQAWANANAYGGASHIVLLEDFDAVFYKRQRQDPSSKLTFDAVLNAIDGLERPEGLILVVTTNDPEAIDPALGAPLAGGGSTRPGRIDLTVAFGPLDEEGRRKVASRIVRDPEWVAEVMAEGAGLSPARFQELCCQKAMRQLWGRRAA